MELHIYKTVDEVIEGLAGFFVQTVNKAIKENGFCRVVLSGGNSPKKLYELLASPAFNKEVDWTSVFFFFGDERMVAFTDPENNGAMANRALFKPLGIAASNIFYINTDLAPEDSAREYQQLILSHFKDEPLRFDLVLLGLGDNGHTASLFPFTTVLHENKALVKAVQVEGLLSSRVTMTAALINEARAIAFLVYGAAKSNAVYEVLEGKSDFEKYPAQLIIPEEGVIDWFMDKEAAGKLQP